MTLEFSPAVSLLSSQMSPFAQSIYEHKYAWKDENGTAVEDWRGTSERVVSNVLGALGYDADSLEYQNLLHFASERKFMAGGRYQHAAGRDLHQTQNCLLLRAEDSREGWADLAQKSIMALMTGAGIGVVYSDLRASNALIGKTGGKSSGPLALMNMINEIGRNVMQGGDRRSAIWAGLHWNHPDVFEFIVSKDWSPEIRATKEADFTASAPLDMTNISVILDDDFFSAYENSDDPKHDWAVRVYHETNVHMLKDAEPGFSVDTGDNVRENLRNACTEITSEDDSDICNLGSINLGRVDTIEEFAEIVRYGTLFLLAGTVYSDLPYAKVHDTRAKNRRLGLGLMGIHEWLLKRGLAYGPNDELAQWLEVYATSTQIAHEYADMHGLSRPVKTRALAPNGTIGIVAETTTGMEPIFCVAYKRRVRDARASGSKDQITFQYVIDPTAKRLIDQGVSPDSIEDAYMLSYDYERRIAFQAWLQQYVDHGISSTVNLPHQITDESDVEDFKGILMKYLPSLRGITCYPDGCRGGQPLTAVPYSVAVGQEGLVFEEETSRCVGGECGA